MGKIITKEGFSYGFDPSACSKCDGRCCRGESGYIFVNSEEIKKIAEFLQLDVETFKKDYLNKVKYRYSIKELKIGGEYECLFFDGKTNSCEIYEVRPTQCRSFPFWDYFKDKVDEVKKECIGIV
ncbi:MAG: YkgJ family cysteine cluster protein [Epsilonproteobacteria bacterium]|nr:YkgJ family cysteine cluster protein [Campylobacterota bacterium]